MEIDESRQIIEYIQVILSKTILEIRIRALERLDSPTQGKNQQKKLKSSENAQSTGEASVSQVFHITGIIGRYAVISFCECGAGSIQPSSGYNNRWPDGPNELIT